MAKEGNEPMTTKQIIAIQERIGVDRDGEWGPKSREACRAYLLSLMPENSPWPSADDESMTYFYGKHGNEGNLVKINVAHLPIKYENTKVSSIRAHKKVAVSLLECLEEIAQSPSAWILAQYGGCYMNRPMRGGKRPSKHAWGAAIDIAPSTNGLRTPWPSSADMPFDAMVTFAKRGWGNLGWEIGRDSMHFQAVKPS